MKQTRIGSATEAMANITVGYWLSVTANLAIFPLFGWQVDLGESMIVGGIYTLISFARSYLLRRLFNLFHG